MKNQKQKIEYVPMYKAVESLTELQTRLSLLFNIMPEVISYIEESDTKNEALKSFIVKTLKENYMNATNVYRGL